MPSALRSRQAPEEPVPDRARQALQAAQGYLLSIQAPDGSWCAELEGDTILESEYVLTMHFLGRTAERRVAKAAETLRRKQLPEGGWAIYPGGPAEPSASVKAYFVLKLVGDDPQAPHMRRAREAILGLGGIEACNSFTKIYLSIFGQYDWDSCPVVPPSLVLLPTWFPFNLYAMSSWSRAIVVPLSIISAHRPRCEVPESASIAELRAGADVGPTDVTKYTGRRTAWTRFFSGVDRFLKVARRLHIKPFERWGIRRAEAWIHERLRRSDGLAAIFPPIVNTIIAFRCLGYELDDPRLIEQVRELERLELEDEDTLRVQPCFSALWDTVQVLNVLAESGLDPQQPALLAAARWVLDHEVRERGDWSVRLPHVEPGGWYFEYANEFYPDCDDTAAALLALSRVRFPDAADEARRGDALRRALVWMRAMQNRDGGWAAFDRDCDREFLTHVPFADHNAMLDPSCEDITGRTLEAFAGIGVAGDDEAIRRAAAYLYATQHEDGSWYGRWGCNHVYGTWLALVGLVSAGEDPADERLRRGAAWLRDHQNPDGGWGELPLSYDRPETRGQGPSTAAQTAWAMLGLMAVEGPHSEAVRRGVAWLTAAQRPDGSWRDEPWTGTGFPRVFYLRYHLYATQFPLLALATYLEHAGRASA